MTLGLLIKEIRKDTETKVKHFKILSGEEQKRSKLLIEKLNILRKLKGNKTNKNIMKAMKVLCFGSIAYCCGSPLCLNGKPCSFRDSFLTALGLTAKDFEEYKKECDELFWKFINKKGI